MRDLSEDLVMILFKQLLLLICIFLFQNVAWSATAGPEQPDDVQSIVDYCKGFERISAEPWYQSEKNIQCLLQHINRTASETNVFGASRTQRLNVKLLFKEAHFSSSDFFASIYSHNNGSIVMFYLNDEFSDFLGHVLNVVTKQRNEVLGLPSRELCEGRTQKFRVLAQEDKTPIEGQRSPIDPRENFRRCSNDEQFREYYQKTYCADCSRPSVEHCLERELMLVGLDAFGVDFDSFIWKGFPASMEMHIANVRRIYQTIYASKGQMIAEEMAGNEVVNELKHALFRLTQIRNSKMGIPNTLNPERREGWFERCDTYSAE